MYLFINLIQAHYTNNSHVMWSCNYRYVKRYISVAIDLYLNDCLSNFKNLAL